MMNCQQATRLMSEAQERTLSFRENVALRLHLLICSGCKNFSTQIPWLSLLMKAHAHGQDQQASPPPGL